MSWTVPADNLPKAAMCWIDATRKGTMEEDNVIDIHGRADGGRLLKKERRGKRKRGTTTHTRHSYEREQFKSSASFGPAPCDDQKDDCWRRKNANHYPVSVSYSPYASNAAHSSRVDAFLLSHSSGNKAIPSCPRDP